MFAKCGVVDVATVIGSVKTNVGFINGNQCFRAPHHQMTCPMNRVNGKIYNVKNICILFINTPTPADTDPYALKK